MMNSIERSEKSNEKMKFTDLLNVSLASKRLNQAACFVFVRKHGIKQVYFKDIRLSKHRLLRFSIIGNGKRIYIEDLKTSLQFIRCFGHLIPDIIYHFEIRGLIHDGNIFKKWKEPNPEERILEQLLFNYLTEYCSETLIKIHIVNGWEGWEEYLLKPFPKINHVRLTDSQVIFKDMISKLCPKIQTLAIRYNCGFEKNLFSEKKIHIPGLGKLIIDVDEMCDEYIVPILRLNPQLEYIKVATNQLHSISSELSNALETMESLKIIEFDVDKLSSNSMNNVIHSESVRKIYVRSTDALKIPFSFRQLNTLFVSSKVQLTSAFFRFIAENPTIRNIEFEKQILSDINQTKLAKSLPLLEFICFRACKFSADEANDFLSKFKYMNCFIFKLEDTTTGENIRKRFGKEWTFESSREFPSLICMKRQIAKRTWAAEGPIKEPVNKTIWRHF